MALFVQGASCSFYTCHSIHTWPYFASSCVLLLSLVFYLLVYITVRFIIHSFQCSTYITLYFHIFILLFSLLVCALAGSLLTDLAFSTSELEETNELLFEGTQEDYQVWVRSFLSYVFWHFVLLCCPDAKILSTFISGLLYFQSCIQTKTIVDVYLLCENEIYGYRFVYVCENLAPLLQRKVFTEEISLFVSIYWPSSRTRILYFEKRGVIQALH